MNEIKAYFDENEKPFDNIVEDGGFCKIFRTIACIGDSLSSGEFQVMLESGKWGYYDMYEYSWGQFMARTCGNTVYNFSQGGMSCREYLNEFADKNDLWNEEKKCQAYIFALGVNDLAVLEQELGTIDDVCENYKDNKDTFAGNFARIVARYKEIAPDAKFFFITMPKKGTQPYDTHAEDQAKLMYQIAEKFDNTYVIDLTNNGPIHDADFRDKFYMGGHMTPAGYALMAKMISSYIDYIIRHNMDDFHHVGFIGKGIRIK
jgi:lysophospholipase L1-like esterase